jgi:fibronectin-binding autotransporter adhesin
MSIPLKHTRVKFCLLAASLLAGLYARSANYDFDNGGGTGAWDLNTNWSPDGLPSTGDNVFVLVPGAASKTITLASTPTNPTINEVGLARTGNGTATVNHTGGSLTVQSWFNLGQGAAAAGNDGTGVWNMSGSSILNATHVGGQTVIGVGFTSSPTYNTGILTLSDSAQFLQTANDIRIGGETSATRAHGTITLNNNSILSLTGGGQFSVGVGANGSTGTLNIHDSATLSTTRQFVVGVNTGSSGTVLQDGTSTVTINGGWANIGSSGAGTYTMNGGTLTFTGAFGLNVGDGSGSTGTMTVNGGQVNVNGPTNPDLYIGKASATGSMSVSNSAQVSVNRNVYVGNSGTSTGTLTLNDSAAFTTGGLFLVGVGATTSGTVVQNGTSTVTINGNYANIGNSGAGTYTMNGGTLTFTGAAGLNVGDSAGSNGTFTMNGGQVNVNGPTTPDLFIGKYTGTGTMTVNNNAQVAVNRNIYLGFSGVSSTGTLTVNNTASVTGASLMVWAGAGTVNVNGGTVNATGWITLGQNAGSTAVFNHNAGNVTTQDLWTTYQAAGTYNLNGGTLTTGNFLKSTGTSTFNFNGGTLKASAGFTLGGGNVTTTQVRNGGAIIDSNGQSATISQALIHSTIGGDAATDGGLAKLGTGTLTLSGTNTYNGPTLINAGVLQIGAGGTVGSLNTSSAITNNGALSINRSDTVTQGTDFAGVIAGTGNFLHIGTGTVVLNGNNTFTGTVTVNPQATLSVPVIATSGAQPLGQGSTPITLRGQLSNFGTLLYSGAGAGETNRGITLDGGSGGKITVSQASGELTVNGALTGNFDFRKDGPGTLILTGSEDWNAAGYVQGGTLVLGSTTSGSPGANSLTGGNWEVSPGATLRINTTGAFESSTVTKTGTFHLESGELKTNTLAGAGAMTWGNATVRPLSELNEGTVDRTGDGYGNGGAASGPVVREGNILEYTGSLTTSGTSGQGSVLNLGGLRSEFSNLRYDQLKVSGALDLSGVDTLVIDYNPYFLRPTSADSVATGDWGSLRMVMADSITGTFNQILGVGNDAIGWRSLGSQVGDPAFTTAANLPLNTYHIEYVSAGITEEGIQAGAAILFHYKVAGSVPEPASAGLIVAGGLLLRTLARRRVV